MTRNKSLSARIKRRNRCGFAGVGTGKKVKSDGTIVDYNLKKLTYGTVGDYNDINQNGKLKDKLMDIARKQKLGYALTPFKVIKDVQGNIVNIYRSLNSSKNRQFNKKYADNHQKI